MILLVAFALVACDRSGEPRDSRVFAPDALLEPAPVFQRTEPHMGTFFTITIAARPGIDVEPAIRAAFDEVARVEQPLSNWLDSSQVSALNRAAGGPAIPVGPDLLTVLRIAREVSDLTSGAFDVTFAACAPLWSWEGSGSDPTSAAVAECLTHVSSGFVELDEASGMVRLTDALTRVGLGGVGKGYGVDRAAAVLRAHGLQDFMVQGSGDIVASGSRHGERWRVGIQHPRAERGRMLGEIVVPPTGVAISTSGDYERYTERGGRRVHHLIDPRTGQPAEGTVSATVIAADATHADALATGIFVLGPEAGVDLAERLPDVEALVVDDRLEVHATAGMGEWVVLYEGR